MLCVLDQCEVRTAIDEEDYVTILCSGEKWHSWTRIVNTKVVQIRWCILALIIIMVTIYSMVVIIILMQTCDKTIKQRMNSMRL